MWLVFFFVLFFYFRNTFYTPMKFLYTSTQIHSLAVPSIRITKIHRHRHLTEKTGKTETCLLSHCQV